MDALCLVRRVCGAGGALLAARAAAALPQQRTSLTADEARARRELRISGRFDRASALELRRRLVEDLRRHEAVRRHLEHAGGEQDREVTALLELVDRSAQATRHEIADVEMWLSIGR